jgi:hypothetical protein
MTDRSQRPRIKEIASMAPWILLRAPRYVTIKGGVNLIVPSLTWDLVSSSTTDLQRTEACDWRTLCSLFVQGPCHWYTPRADASLRYHTIWWPIKQSDICLFPHRYLILPRVLAITVLYLFLMITISPAHFYLLDFMASKRDFYNPILFLASCDSAWILVLYSRGIYSNLDRDTGYRL